ncbi:hypothetical protein LTS12_020931 [Elasticomyces elasticus]|nr:hypothetical protein LTS12_020931 [Elasticomyces elasticus]
MPVSTEITTLPASTIVTTLVSTILSSYGVTSTLPTETTTIPPSTDYQVTTETRTEERTTYLPASSITETTVEHSTATETTTQQLTTTLDASTVTTTQLASTVYTTIDTAAPPSTCYSSPFLDNAGFENSGLSPWSIGPIGYDDCYFGDPNPHFFQWQPCSQPLDSTTLTLTQPASFCSNRRYSISVWLSTGGNDQSVYSYPFDVVVSVCDSLGTCDLGTTSLLVPVRDYYTTWYQFSVEVDTRTAGDATSFSASFTPGSGAPPTGFWINVDDFAIADVGAVRPSQQATTTQAASMILTSIGGTHTETLTTTQDASTITFTQPASTVSETFVNTLTATETQPTTITFTQPASTISTTIVNTLTATSIEPTTIIFTQPASTISTTLELSEHLDSNVNAAHDHDVHAAGVNAIYDNRHNIDGYIDATDHHHLYTASFYGVNHDRRLNWQLYTASCSLSITVTFAQPAAFCGYRRYSISAWIWVVQTLNNGLFTVTKSVNLNASVCNDSGTCDVGSVTADLTQRNGYSQITVEVDTRTAGAATSFSAAFNLTQSSMAGGQFLTGFFDDFAIADLGPVCL